MENTNTTGKKKNIWAFGTNQVVYAAIGAALYAVITWAFNVWQIPGAGNVGIRPGIVIIPGIFSMLIYKYNEKKSILFGELSVLLGVALGMALASVSEIWVSGADMNTVLLANFLPSFLTNIVWGLILLPVLMIAYAAIVQRSGR